MTLTVAASNINELGAQVSACQICADQFAATETRHRPNPVFWLSDTAKILICGQAPGARVHASGRPFTDPSGDRLREWMGVSEEVFFDRSSIAILPMAFCFPGYDAKGSDLAPPRQCAQNWRKPALALMPNINLTLLVGGYAQKWHVDGRTVTETVRNWKQYGPAIIPLPHPSWRTRGWAKKNPWFEEELLPVLKARIKQELDPT